MLSKHFGHDAVAVCRQRTGKGLSVPFVATLGSISIQINKNLCSHRSLSLTPQRVTGSNLGEKIYKMTEGFEIVAFSFRNSNL